MHQIKKKKTLHLKCVLWPAQENFLRTIERVAFFFLAPGFTDHWPSDYEFKVRALRFVWLGSLPFPLNKEPLHVAAVSRHPCEDMAHSTTALACRGARLVACLWLWQGLNRAIPSVDSPVQPARTVALPIVMPHLLGAGINPGRVANVCTQHSQPLCCSVAQLRNVALNTTADGIVDKSKAGNAARRRPRIIEDKNTYHFA